MTHMILFSEQELCIADLLLFLLSFFHYIKERVEKAQKYGLS